MSTDAWQRVERIFAEARALPPGERSAFLAEACVCDDALRRDVQALLVADDSAGTFMERPALDSLADAVASAGWRLQPGEHIGAYTVVRLLGSGGAGEVWRARDERLGRDVAIKVLLPHYSADPERLRRFAEEARTAGALNHSNILTVYDVGEHRGTPYLVSECLDGQSLRERITAGPLRADEAVTLTLGLARGLAAAHARGIIHRDLKPENTFIRADGIVKILDFGLAKLQSSLGELDGAPSQTVTGVILGTAGYMSPEQINGGAVDARADLFSVGVMLYEMLTGRNPFRGASTFETLHAVLTVDPPDLADHGVPPALAGIVMRLLSKPPEGRFQSALDLAWALDQNSGRVAGLTTQPTATRTAGTPRIGRSTWAILSAAAIGVLAMWTLIPRSSPGEPTLMQFAIPLPSGTSLQSAPAVSPDGRYVAFTARGTTPGTRLYVRALASRDAIPVPGGEGAQYPFWSPDGSALGFFKRVPGESDARLMTVSWPDGAAVPIATAPFPLGGAWSRSGTILFGPDVIMSGLFRVPVAGGDSQPATALSPQLGDNVHGWPMFLPDGVHYLYFVRSTDARRRGVYLGGLNRPSSEPGSLLFQSESDAVYVALPDGGGAILSVADDRVAVRRFDPVRLALSGDARILDLPAAGGNVSHPAMLGASRDVLAFAASGLPYGSRLEIVDRAGRRLRFWDAAEPQNWPRVSPDGTRLARQRVDWSTNNPDIWVDDLARGPQVRVTTAVEPDIQAVWSPDGRSLAYVSGILPGRPGKAMLTIAAADGSGVERAFPCPSSGYCEPTDWSAAGRMLVVNVSAEKGTDVWTVSPDSGAARPLLNNTYDERDARVSPDGRWVAYVSRESGRPEVSVRSVEGTPRRIVVSAAGGNQPVWRRDGDELFFVDPTGQLNTAPVAWRRDGPVFGAPIALKVPAVGFGHWGTQYDVSPDGSRIYLLRAVDDPPPRDIQVVVGWRRLLDAGSGSVRR